MIQPAYIGYPNKQDSVVQTLTREAKINSSGIFIVGGAGRVGKNTTIKRVVEEGLRLPIARHFGEVIRPDVNMYDEIPDTYFNQWDEAYREGKNIFAFGEIPINFTSAFKYIEGFYNNGLEDGRNLKILFNVISRNHPAWENDEVEADIQNGLIQSFSKNLHLEFLTSDRNKIVKEMWRFRNEGMGFHVLASEFGFKKGVVYEADTQSYDKFEGYLKKQMEGNNSRTERW